MTGLPLIIAFIVAIVLMIVMISKFKIHPFISIMCVSLILGLIAGIPIVDRVEGDFRLAPPIAPYVPVGYTALHQL